MRETCVLAFSGSLGERDMMCAGIVDHWVRET